MSIWNDPDISFEQFAKYLCDDKNKAALKKIWMKKTKDKEFLSELENYELSDILVSFERECILSYDSNCGVLSDQLQDSSHLLSDWIFENKLSGIPSSDDEDYNKMKLIDIFNNNNLLFNWISQSCIPLKTYINSKNAHDPSLSQQEITAKNKRIIQKHPSLAHLFQQKLVNQKQNEFNEYKQTQKQKQQKEYDKKHENANENIHQLRKSRAMLFFNYSDIGYETKKKCKIYKNQRLTQFLIEVAKGELFGGKSEDKNNEIIHIIEPIKGYIHSKYLKIFDLNSTQWKFLQHQRSTTSTATQSLILRINNDDLLIPPDDDYDTNENTKKVKVKFTPYNENEDEKKLEEVKVNNNNYNNNNNNNNNNNMHMSLKEKRLINCKENAKNILHTEKSLRVARDVVTLWVSGFNLHDLDILKECYNPQVTSQQFVNQELMARDPILQCLKQMFNASDDVGIDITNIIIKQGNVILEFTTFGTRKDNNNSNRSPTNSNSKNSNNSDNLLGSHPTKSGLPQKIINGVGIFTVSNGEIINQRLFWDQDQQWFSDMNVIKMPQTSTLSHFLYKNKLAPVLNLSDQHLENGSLSNTSNDDNTDNNNEAILHANAGVLNQDTLNGDNNIIYEMNAEMNEILALRGLNISDLKQYENKKQYRLQNKKKQLAQAIFWIAVGAMFVFIVPKYLGKPKR